jgi:hypothetical protein
MAATLMYEVVHAVPAGKARWTVGVATATIGKCYSQTRSRCLSGSSDR